MNQSQKNLIKKIVPLPILNRCVRIVMWFYDKFNSPTGSSVREVFKKLRVEQLEFFRKKTPKSNCYPYAVHYPALLKNVPAHSGRLYLIGQNWVDAPEKPYAIGLGFNDWKLGFISAYIPDHRMAFATGKFIKWRRRRNLFINWRGRRNLRRLDPQPSAIYTWGYKAPNWLEGFAAKRNIPLIRVEDGFIRSAKLGAKHTTPYSLVFDSQGMHYRNDLPNDLTTLLEEYDFSDNPDLLAQAAYAINLIVENKISKYNPPNFELVDAHFHVKTRKKILVLGQVDKDAAVTFGNPDKWSMVNLVRVAKLENPDADVFYRPHPEVYHGFQKTKFRNWQTTGFAKIIPPSVPFLNSLEGVDQVYTITSLSGLEALIRGVKVTVMGTPFYSGWGLTDDRAETPKRKRMLTLNELFAIVYLKYPKYLADLEDASLGLKSACLRIEAERTFGEVEYIQSFTEFDIPTARRIASSNYWPSLFFNNRLKNISPEELEKILRHTNFDGYFRGLYGENSKIIIMLFICGQIKNVAMIDGFLTTIRELVKSESYNQILLALNTSCSGDYLTKHFSWLLNQYSIDGDSCEFVSGKLQSFKTAKKDEDDKRSEFLSDQIGKDSGLKIEDDGDGKFSPEEIELTKDLFTAQSDNTKYDEALATAHVLLAAGDGSTDLLFSSAELAKHRFDLTSAYELGQFMLYSAQGSAGKAISLMCEMNPVKEIGSTSRDLSLWSVLKPPAVVPSISKLDRFEKTSEREVLKKALMRMMYLDNDQTINKMHGFLSIEENAKAINIIETIISNSKNVYQYGVAYAQALAFDQQLDKANQVIQETLRVFPTSLVYREALRNCILRNDYDKALVLLSKAMNENVDLLDMTPRKIYFGARMPKQALETFREYQVKLSVAKHLKEYYDHTPELGAKNDSLFLLPIFGPGDEVRFASIYNLLRKSLKQQEIYIGCEPRLEPLMKRSFPELNVVPVKRLLRDINFDIADYDEIPSFSLRMVMDNHAMTVIKDVKKVALVTDLLASYLLSYDAFPKVSYLKADTKKVNALKKRLPKDRPLIGLSWRSSLTFHSRNEHYLSIQELAPILALDQFQFVNLQYDDCAEELAWAEEHFPGQLIDLEEIDQYNDFDSVAALMKALDLIVAPATTVVELAGALGCPTWLLSNSSELHWRKLDGTLTDVWHNSITHVEGEVLQNKESLVARLRASLLAIE